MPVYHKPTPRSTPIKHCNVCLQDAIIPKQLACDHMICQSCVRNQISRLSDLLDKQESIKIVCPHCKDYLLSNLKIFGDSRLHTRSSFLLEPRPKTSLGRVSEQRASYTGDRKAQRCQPCAEGSIYELASFWCHNCSEYLCSLCARYHQSMKMAKTHIVKTIRDKERYENIPSKIYATSRPLTAKYAECSRNCEPCSYNKKTSTADFFCESCKEQMCGDCAKCHRSMKMSKSHKLTLMKEVLARSESDLSLRCDRHKGEIMSLYCKRCKTSCCSMCAISVHANCGKAMKLEAAVKKDSENKKAVSGSTAQGGDIKGTAPIKYSWDSVSKEPGKADDKTVSFSITPVSKSKLVLPKNKMEFRKRRIEIEYSKPKDWVISFALLTTGDVLLIQLYGQNLIMVDPNGDELSMCRFYGDPWSVAVYKDNLAVVSFSDRKQLQLVHITRAGLEPGKKLGTRHKCMAVCFAKNLIAASCWQGCIHVINISGEEICSIEVDHKGESLFTNPEYIASDVTGSTLYVTDFKRNSVTALTLLPNKIISRPVFVFKDKELKGPKGVAVDKNGVIYVSGMSSRNVFRLAPSGQVVQIYRRREDTDYYEAIAVTPEADKLYVSAYEDSTLIEFKLSK